MNQVQNIPSILCKSALLAAVIFWAQIIEAFNMAFFPILIFSIIPIAIVSSLTIFVTIMPFYVIGGHLSNHEIFKRYFPYYAIFTFGIASYYIFCSNFDSIVCAFFSSAFFTLMTAWVWIFKTPTMKTEKEEEKL
jgi:hypothetical protein